MNASILIAPDDDGVASPEILRRIVGSLTAADVRLLERLEREMRIDVETIDADAQALLWMGHFGLYGIEVDRGDRVFLVRREEGKAAIDERFGRTSKPKPERRRGIRRGRCAVGKR